MRSQYSCTHCLLYRFYLLVKNPNSLFTMFTCLFLIIYDSWIKIVWAHLPLHNRLSFLYFNYAFAMFCWFILTVIQHCHFTSLLEFYYNRKILGYYGLKGAKESSFVFGFCSPKPIHVSYFTCRKNPGPNIFFKLRLDLLLTLSNGQAAFSMPLVYSFYCEESIVSLSSKFLFSGLRMSPLDPMSD